MSSRNEELEKVKLELERLNHFKNHLLSLASHEVRAPLAIIKGYAASLRQGLFGKLPEKAEEILRKVEFAASDLLNFLEDVIDLRRIEEGRIQYVFEETDLNLLAEKMADFFGPIAKAKGLDFEFVRTEGPLPVKADRHYVEHTIQNLIDNAIKYTRKGFVKVELLNEGGWAIFRVSDSGIGVKPQTIPLLFEEFVRDERVGREIKGSGLGLHIAKSIIEAHGGKIWGESEGEGRGSTFGFWLSKSTGTE